MISLFNKLTKITALVLVLSTFCCANLRADELSKKDSVMLVADTIASARDRIDYLFKMGSVNLNEKWRLDLIDMALKESEAANDSSRQIKALFERARHFLFWRDVSKQYKSFEELRIRSYKFGIYSSYFKIWYSLLQHSVANGDVEFALIQAQKMEEEAKSLLYYRGEMLALQIQAAVYGYKKEREKSISLYAEVIRSGKMTDMEVIRIMRRVSRSLINMKEFDRALAYIQQADSVVNLIKLDKNRVLSQSNNIFLAQNLAYTIIYLSMEDLINAKVYLERSKQYLSSENFHTQVLLYHVYLGRYYSLMGRYKDADVAFKKAYELVSEENHSYRFYLLYFIGENYRKEGDMDNAIAAAKRAAEMSDSVNTATLARLEEVIQSNYQIQNNLLLSQQHKVDVYIWIILLVSMLLLLIIIITVRSFLIKLQLRRVNKTTQEALLLLEKNNKDKEQFLKTITFEVRIPLNTVVGFVDILSSDESLTEEEIAEYSKLVNHSASGLMELINQVLDVSRLEAGMMQFNKQPLDVVGLCKDAVMMVQMNSKLNLNIGLEIEVDSFDLVTDQQWFLRVINSLITPTKADSGQSSPQIKLESEADVLCITVSNSPLYDAPKSQQYLRMQDMLNRIAMNQLGYSYELGNAPNGKVVRIVCSK